MNDRQKKALDMLWNGARVQETASALGVHRCTIWRWGHRKDFQKEWRRRCKAEEALIRRAARKYARRMFKEHEANLRRLEANLSKASANIQQKGVKSLNDPALKALDRAYNAWAKEAFKGCELWKKSR